MAMIDTLEPVVHPFRKTETQLDDRDGLCIAYLQVKEEMGALSSFEHKLRLAIDRLSTGEKKTRRVYGDRYEAKVVSASPYWSQSIMKELAKEDPEQSKIYLRISAYAPELVEVKKMENATGNERFERYKQKLLSARSPSTSPASVTVTERKVK